MNNLKLFILLLIVAGGVTAAATLPVGDYADAFLDWVEGLGAWGPVIIGLAYIPATVLFIPGLVLTLGAGAIFGVLEGTIAVSIGSTLGSTMAFIVGRFFARDWVSRRVENNDKFKAVDAAVGEHGFKIVLLTRLSPVFPYNLLGYMYGITNVRLKDYILASWIGMFPGTLMYVYLGSVLGEVSGTGDRERTTSEWILYGCGLLATLVVTIYVTKIARKALKEAAPGSEEDDDAEEASEAAPTAKPAPQG